MISKSVRSLLPGALLVLFLAAAVLAGCERIAPIRTLPSWVRGIYIPMVENTSYEPGLEEEATRRIQEAFLLDGRLDVVRKDEADLELVVEITDFLRTTDGSSGDKIADRDQFELFALVRLYEPYNQDEPYAELPPISIRRSFRTDPRSIRYDAEPDLRGQLLEQLAQVTVIQTINGFPTRKGSYVDPSAVPIRIRPEEVDEREVLTPRRGTAY